MGAGSGGGFEGDLVAEGFELADVVALGAVGVDAGVVEAGAEVTEAGLGVDQQVPDNDQDGPAYRHDRLVGAASASDAPIALPKEPIGPPGSHGGLPKHAGALGLPCPVVAVPLRLPADSLTPGANLAHQTRCPAVGNRAMSTPISAMSRCAGVWPVRGISPSRSTARANGPINASILVSSAAMSALSASIRSSILASRNP